MTLKTGAKRFYKDVAVREEGDGFAVLLDGRTIKTPAGAVMLAPTRRLGDAIAREWQGQGETLLPETMPLTKALNTALDRVAANRAALVDDLAKYANSDLLCYRADAPEGLVERQAAAWDPWLDWAAVQYGARLATVTGVTHVTQSAEALECIKSAIARFGDVELAALHVGITITGSAVLGLAFAARALTAEEAFALAHLDETFQAERWGQDAEAERMRDARLGEFVVAGRLLDLLTADPKA
jgi:chaperone required for assembly of F1-ATPase